MHKLEIQIFTEALKLAKDHFFIDAIQKFQKLVDDYSDSDIADDAMFNIGLCYYEMNQFQKCIKVMEEMIRIYPDATISTLEIGNEYGKTAGKAYFLIVQCYIGLGNIQKAEYYINYLENYLDTYIIKGQKKITFLQLANESFNTYCKMIERD